MTRMPGCQPLVAVRPAPATRLTARTSPPPPAAAAAPLPFRIPALLPFDLPLPPAPPPCCPPLLDPSTATHGFWRVLEVTKPQCCRAHAGRGTRRVSCPRDPPGQFRRAALPASGPAAPAGKYARRGAGTAAGGWDIRAHPMAGPAGKP